MRDRRGIVKRQEEEQEQRGAAAVAMPGETAAERTVREKKKVRKEKRRGLLSYALMLLIIVGIPIFFVVRLTPFFVFQNLNCRLRDKVWRDDAVARMEAGYARYFDEPPLYLSEAYNRTTFWGTYEPSRIFAMKSQGEAPVTVGFAWYDRSGAHPLRHHMPYTHNKVVGSRYAQKRGRDPEVMSVRWLVHDGIHYGREMVKDKGNKATLEFEFLKSPSGNAWHVRVHGTVEGDSPLQLVVYVANGNSSEQITVRAPDTDNDGDWSPVLESRHRNAAGAAEPFTLRVYDDHHPLYDTAPWRIHGLRTDLDKAFALQGETVGGTPAERAMTEGKGITGGRAAAEFQRQGLNLQHLPKRAFTYIFEKSRRAFRTPEADEQTHNLVVLKKSYDSDFRLELSLSPADAVPASAEVAKGRALLQPRYEALTTCQLKNAFRLRDKAIHHHARKIFKPWVKSLNAASTLYELMAANTLSEMFGSQYFGVGRYLQAPLAADEAADRDPAAATDAPADLVDLVPSRVVGALAAVGSRTDEPFGQQHLTGLQQLFLVRWNKEMVKEALARWLVGAQDPATGFVPSRALFTEAARSLAAEQLRYEHPTEATPPTLLLALRELLQEMDRKQARAARSKSKKKLRNRPEYLAREAAADRAFLELVLPALRRWRAWWHRTQCGGHDLAAAQNCSAARRPLEAWPTRPTGRPEDLLAYRWRSRNSRGRLPASGMPDYPRPVQPGAHQLEAHVDLFAWVALLSQLVTRVEAALDLPPSVTVDWEAHLAAQHWDAAQERYADRVGAPSRAFSTYTGYVNLYPVVLGVARNPGHVRATLALARRELWSAYGLMATSIAAVKQAREEGLRHDELWNGYVWPSTHLLLLHSLKTVYSAELQMPEATELYEVLRKAQVETIRGGSRWWEYFNPLDGRGEGSKTYIGTRSLVLGILDDYQ